MELRQLQAQPELLASTEAFKTSERELSIAQRELQKLLDTYRAALGLYHRTVCRPPGRQAGRQAEGHAAHLLADVRPRLPASAGARLPAAPLRGGTVLRAGALSRRRAAAAGRGQKVDKERAWAPPTTA